MKVNSSKNSRNKSNIIVEVVLRISSSIKNSFRYQDRNSYSEKSNDNINDYCLICEEKLTEQEKIDI